MEDIAPLCAIWFLAGVTVLAAVIDVTLWWDDWRVERIVRKADRRVAVNRRLGSPTNVEGA